MKSTFKVLGIIGLICVGFGFGVGLYTGNFKQSSYVLTNIGIGTILVLISAIVNAGELKAALTGRSSKAGANAIVTAAAVIAILVLVNFIANRNHKRFDLTENKKYSLSDATLSLVRGLEKDIKVTGFFVGGQAGPVKDVLDGYRYTNDKRFSWEIVDPDKRPELAERYGIRANGTLVIESGAERKTLSDVNPGTLEESLTNAILALSTTGKKTLCSVVGHGERAMDDEQAEDGFGAARKALEGENYEVKPLLLASVAAVPADCTIVLIAGPEKAFFDTEAAALNAYLEKGGSLFVMLEPRTDSRLAKLMQKWGIEVRDDIVVDKVVRMFEGEQLGIQPIITTYAPEHPITRGFTKQTTFVMARSIGSGTAPEGYAVTELAKTSPGSWGETAFEAMIKTGEVSLDKADQPGPLALAVAVGPTGDREGKAKIVVVGDVDFGGNRFVKAFFNGDFFLNSVNWLANQEKQISIRPKGPRASFVRLTDEQMGSIFHLAVLIFPQLLLTLGIIVGWRRR